jgi:hypothetical protein
MSKPHPKKIVMAGLDPATQGRTHGVLTPE